MSTTARILIYGPREELMAPVTKRWDGDPDTMIRELISLYDKIGSDAAGYQISLPFLNDDAATLNGIARNVEEFRKDPTIVASSLISQNPRKYFTDFYENGNLVKACGGDPYCFNYELFLTNGFHTNKSYNPPYPSQMHPIWEIKILGHKWGSRQTDLTTIIERTDLHWITRKQLDKAMKKYDS